MVRGGVSSESAPFPSDERFETVARSRVGGVRVERFEGLRAGEAIAAVRRLGLRPAPERVEGYEPDLHGFVVDQEPAEGGELQAGDQVVLFIAAPSRARVDDDVSQPEGDEAEQAAATDVLSLPQVDDGVGVEALHVGEPGYADESVEVHELPLPSDRPPEIDEPFSDPELDRPWRGNQRGSLIASARSWWRRLPAATRWLAAGGSGCLLLVVVVALLSAGTSTPHRPARRVMTAARPSVDVKGRARRVHRAARRALGNRPVCSAEPCHGRERRDGRSVSRPRARVVYVNEGSVASAPPAVSDPPGARPGGGAPPGESAAEHMAREFGSP